MDHRAQQGDRRSPGQIWAALRDLHSGGTNGPDNDTFELHGPFAVGTEISVTPRGRTPSARRSSSSWTNGVRRRDASATSPALRHTLTPLAGGGTTVTHRLEITGRCRAGGPELGPQISEDFPAAMAVLSPPPRGARRRPVSPADPRRARATCSGTPPCAGSDDRRGARALDLTHVQFVLLTCLWWMEEQSVEPNQRALARQAGTDVKMTSRSCDPRAQGPPRAPYRPGGHPGEDVASHGGRARLARRAVGIVEAVDQESRAVIRGFGPGGYRAAPPDLAPLMRPHLRRPCSPKQSAQAAARGGLSASEQLRQAALRGAEALDQAGGLRDAGHRPPRAARRGRPAAAPRPRPRRPGVGPARRRRPRRPR